MNNLSKHRDTGLFDAIQIRLPILRPESDDAVTFLSAQGFLAKRHTAVCPTEGCAKYGWSAWIPLVIFIFVRLAVKLETLAC